MIRKLVTNGLVAAGLAAATLAGAGTLVALARQQVAPKDMLTISASSSSGTN